MEEFLTFYLQFRVHLLFGLVLAPRVDILLNKSTFANQTHFFDRNRLFARVLQWDLACVFVNLKFKDLSHCDFISLLLDAFEGLNVTFIYELGAGH